MRQMKWSFVFLIVFSLVSLSLHAQTTNDPVGFLKSFYAKYFKASRSNVGNFAHKNLQYFDTQLANLFKIDQKNSKKVTGMICGYLDFDPIGATNAEVTKIKNINLISQSTGKASVKIVFVESPKDSIVVHLVEVQGSWKISDINYDQEGYKYKLKETLLEVQKEKC